MLVGPILYQIMVSVLGLIGAFIGLILLRSVRLWKWRQTGYRFVAALTLYSILELMEVTDIFYDPAWVQILAQGLFILYMVYGIFNLKLVIQEETN
jgi:hypothetical protein